MGSVDCHIDKRPIGRAFSNTATTVTSFCSSFNSSVVRFPCNIHSTIYRTQPESPRDVRQPGIHHLPRCAIRSQIPPVKVREYVGPQIINQPFIRRSVYRLPVQRQQVLMFRYLCHWLIDNIPYTVLAQCIVDIKLYSSVSYYPPPCYF